MKVNVLIIWHSSVIQHINLKCVSWPLHHILLFKGIIHPKNNLFTLMWSQMYFFLQMKTNKDFLSILCIWELFKNHIKWTWEKTLIYQLQLYGFLLCSRLCFRSIPYSCIICREKDYFFLKSSTEERHSYTCGMYEGVKDLFKLYFIVPLGCILIVVV